MLSIQLWGVVALYAFGPLAMASRPLHISKIETSGPGCPTSSSVNVHVSGASSDDITVAYSAMRLAIGPGAGRDDNHTSSCDLRLEVDQIPFGWELFMQGAQYGAEAELDSGVRLTLSTKVSWSESISASNWREFASVSQTSTQIRDGRFNVSTTNEPTADGYMYTQCLTREKAYGLRIITTATLSGPRGASGDVGGGAASGLQSVYDFEYGQCLT